MFLAFARAASVAFAETLADTLAPPACAACDARLPGRVVLCRPCAAGVVRAPVSTLSTGSSGLPIVAFGAFGGPLAEALRRLKYGDRPDLARPLGHLLRQAARRARVQADVVVPVPLHRHRLVERGYNQAALLARAVARELEVPFAARALARTRHTAQQARLLRAERLENVVGAFRVRRPEVLRDRRVVIVDDVATTGATLLACAAALREAGARSVTAMVLARADHELVPDDADDA